MIKMRRNGIGLVMFMCLGSLLLLPSCGKRVGKKTWQQAYDEAIKMVKSRRQWPASPEEVCKVFWEARRARDYKEMEILWPGSEFWNWPEMCRDDPDVKYVFGKANKTGTGVPYAEEGYFREHGSYNLTMRMGSLQTSRGLRYYIVFGN